MNFETILKEHIKLHPSMQPQDFVKLCFQAAYGAEHFLADVELARRFFDEEFTHVSAHHDPLYETISDRVFRINLRAWKKNKLPQEWLFNMFLLSTRVETNMDHEQYFLSRLEVVEKLMKSGDLSFSFQDWLTYKDAYLKEGIRAVHHSEVYRKSEQPSYRIVSREFISLLPILQHLHAINDHARSMTIAIDGRAASGKTTLAKKLGEIIGASVIHMDDFFLPSSLRTERRLSEPGGNVHYERFAEEVIPYLRGKNSFSYQQYDCSIMDFTDDRRVNKSKWYIVEGAYSCHPQFDDYMDVRIFSHISRKEQLNRIRARNGEKLAEKYRTVWVPMEELYLETFGIREKADLEY